MAMQIVRRATAGWTGSDSAGSGTIALGSGAFEGAYSLRSRVGDERHTNPEELIGAAVAGCFTMSLANKLTEDGAEVVQLETSAATRMAGGDGGFSITEVAMTLTAKVRGASVERVEELARQAHESCPVARALAGTNVTLTVRAEVTDSAVGAAQ
ncbi:OsmC family peroxiredoxin [Kineococcus sp. SYSU DK003]|uniref:OsmC family peroxiredoxin n=1 Tax=Kineococcus sp. SYSU DK003 TaxID=3383124 RepID=UPI003D7DB5B4